MKYTLPEIRHELAGFEALIKFYSEAQKIYFNHIDIDMSNVIWFDADMCAVFGAILYKLRNSGNIIQISGMRSNIHTILARNGFLRHHGGMQIRDSWNTTIMYERFDPKDDRYFSSYIQNNFMSRPELPKMSLKLQAEFQKSVFEIFSNAVSHSRTQLGIFSCGQFYPNRKKLDFSIVDLGIGIRQNIFEVLNLSMSAEDAIKWATTENHTTRQGPIPGGLGLKLLKEFIDKNGGKIQIVSDAGYWARSKGNTITHPMSAPFPGTIVNIEINTDDKCAYVLSSEINPDNIF